MERRRTENASLRHWIELGDKALGTTDAARRNIVARKQAKDAREQSKKLRSAVQETRRKARESRRKR